MSKPPGTEHLKLTCDILLSNFAFIINSRRYNMGAVLVFKHGDDRPSGTDQWDPMKAGPPHADIMTKCLILSNFGPLLEKSTSKILESKDAVSI